MSVWSAARIKGSAGDAAPMDAVGQRLVELAERGDWPQALIGLGDEQNGQRPQPLGPFAALPPSVLRVATVHAPGAPSLKPGTQGETTSVAGAVAWFQCPAPGSGPAGDPQACWRVWGLEPTQQTQVIDARHREIQKLLGAAAKGDRAWLARGILRPARVVEALPAPLGFAAGLSGVGSIKEVRFESWEEHAGQTPCARTRMVLEWAQP